MKITKQFYRWIQYNPVPIILLILLGITVQNNLIQIEIKQSHKQTQTILLEVIAERNHLDSLYHDHLSECSFISKKEVAVDSRGYFYSTYTNNPRLVQNE